MLRPWNCHDDFAFNDCSSPQSASSTAPVRCDAHEDRGSNLGLPDAQIFQEFDLDRAFVWSGLGLGTAENGREAETSRKQNEGKQSHTARHKPILPSNRMPDGVDWSTRYQVRVEIPMGMLSAICLHPTQHWLRVSASSEGNRCYSTGEHLSSSTR
jgi:hypothetical protein